MSDKNEEKWKAYRKTYMKAYEYKDKEKRKAYSKAYSKAYEKTRKPRNRKNRSIYMKKYWQNHPGKRKSANRKYRALKRGNNHVLYTDNYIFERDGWICGICDQKINKRLKYPNPRSGSIDHIVPLAKGGANAPLNVQAAHLRCNLGKNATNKGQLRLFG